VKECQQASHFHTTLIEADLCTLPEMKRRKIILRNHFQFTFIRNGNSSGGLIGDGGSGQVCAPLLTLINWGAKGVGVLYLSFKYLRYSKFVISLRYRYRKL
jgi:hypothetical protein